MSRLPVKTETLLDRHLSFGGNFGALRLVLAALVIFSHCYPSISGSFDGEILWNFTGGQMELGAVAVNLFFAASGYLITLSWLRTPRMTTFLLKRVLRIYPGFVVASIVSLLIVAPLAGAQASIAFAPVEIAKHVLRVVLLSSPKAIGSFAGHPIDTLNLSLWTIRYEFICYLMVPMLCVLLARFGRTAVFAMYLALLATHAAQGKYLVQTGGVELPFLGSTLIWPRFLCYFVGGMVVALYRDVIPYSRSVMAASLLILVVTARWTGGFFIVFAVAGIYLLFYVAYQRLIPLSHVGKKHDLSYGTYLYGWPVQMLYAHYLGVSATPMMVFALALPTVLLLAALSWRFVEEPFMRAKAMLTAAPSATDHGVAPSGADYFTHLPTRAPIEAPASYGK